MRSEREGQAFYFFFGSKPRKYRIHDLTLHALIAGFLPRAAIDEHTTKHEHDTEEKDSRVYLHSLYLSGELIRRG